MQLIHVHGPGLSAQLPPSSSCGCLRGTRAFRSLKRLKGLLCPLPARETPEKTETRRGNQLPPPVVGRQPPTCEWIGWECRCADFIKYSVSLHLSYLLFCSGQSQAKQLLFLWWGLCSIVIFRRLLWPDVWRGEKGFLFPRERLFSDGCLLVKFLFKIMDTRDKCLRRVWTLFLPWSGVKTEKF